jgi:hypothetical protein
MRNIIKRILNEQFQSTDYLEKVSRILEPPYFYNMKEHFNVTDSNDQLEVLKYIFGDGITIDGFARTIFSNDYIVYSEGRNDWYEYDENGNEIYSEGSDDYWYKREYDQNWNLIYQEDSDGKIIDKRNITESKIIKRIMNEQVQRPDYLEKVSNILLQSGPPYFQLMEDNFDVTDRKDQYEVLHYIYGDDITISKGTSSNISNDYGRIYDSNNNQLYYENSDGDWNKSEYDEDGNMLYFEKSDGYWSKYEYDLDRNVIYFENSDGNWYKKEYDSDGNEIYFVDNNGTWEKTEFDSRGKVIYFESNDGIIIDKR